MTVSIHIGYRLEYRYWHQEDAWEPYARAAAPEPLLAAMTELKEASPSLVWQIVKVTLTEEVLEL